MNRYRVGPSSESRRPYKRRDSSFLSPEPIVWSTSREPSRDPSPSPKPERQRKRSRTRFDFSRATKEDKHARVKQFISSRFKCKECKKFVEAKNGTCHCGEVKEKHYKFSDLPRSGAPNNLSSDGKAWDAERDIEKLKTNAFGEINFGNEGIEGSKPAKYVRVSDDTDVVDVLELLTSHWRMAEPCPPNLVITVIGGAKNFKLSGKKKEVFNSGLVEAARTTHAWIITSGCNMGVMKAVGDAVAEGQTYHFQEHCMTSMTPTLRCIGIAPWGYVEGREQLVLDSGQGNWNANYKVSNIINTGQPVPLNQNHTHFLLVDDGRRRRYGGVADFRARLEEKILSPCASTGKLQDGGLGVPVVLVVVEGGADAIEDVSESLKRKIPVVICDSTGRAADILAYAYHHFTGTSEGGQTTKVEKMLYNAYGETWEKRGKNVEKETKKYLDMVLNCCKDENLISVFDMNTINEDLDSAILLALLKATQQSAASDAKSIEFQNKTQLNLALTWNRSDIAEEKIFNKDIQWKAGILDDIMTRALTDDKVQFVRLLLQNGMSMKEYLTARRLKQLYNSCSRESHLYKLLEKSGRRGDMEGGFTLTDVHKLLAKLMGRASTDFNFQDDQREEHLTFHHPFRELFLWALLMNRMDMARFLWERADEAIPSALAASLIYQALADRVATYDHDMKDNYLHCKDVFEQLAVKVLEECHVTLPGIAAMLVERRYESWGNRNCLEIAAKANDREFLSSVCCQNQVMTMWKAGLICSSRKAFLSTVCCQNCINSLWHQGVLSKKMVVAALFFPPLIFWAVRFDNDKDDKQPSAVEKLVTFYRAPITKFAANCAWHILFLVLYSYLLLVDYQPQVTTTEMVMTAWMVTLLMEEIREMFFVSSHGSLVDRLRDYWHFSFFNRIDIAILVLAVVGFGLRAREDLYVEAKTVYCINGVCLFMRSLSFYSASSYLGPKLVMISRMVQELMLYLLILVVFLLAYGVSSQSLMYPVRQDPSALIIRDIIYYPYWQIYGELYLDELEGTVDDCLDNTTGVILPNGNPCPTYSWLVPILTGLYLLFGNVLLLNLLIAIFSNVFNEVEKNSIQIWKYGMYNLVVEYDQKPGLAPPFIVFEHLFLICKWCARKTCCRQGEQEKKIGKDEVNSSEVFQKQMVRSCTVRQNTRDVSDTWIRHIMAKVDEMHKRTQRLLDMLGEPTTCTTPDPTPEPSKAPQPPIRNVPATQGKTTPRGGGKGKALPKQESTDDNNAQSDFDNTELPGGEKRSLKEKLIEEEEYDRLNFHRDPPRHNYPDTYDTITKRGNQGDLGATGGWVGSGSGVDGDREIPGMSGTQSEAQLETLMTTQLQTPPTHLQTPPTQPTQLQSTVTLEEFSSLEERFKTFEENTSASLHNIEALLRNAVFSRGGTHTRGPTSAFMQFGSDRRY